MRSLGDGREVILVAIRYAVKARDETATFNIKCVMGTKHLQYFRRNETTRRGI